MWDAACPCVVCLCVCVLSSWHSSTNLSSIQIFHSDGKRPDSNSIVPWKVHFHLFDVQQNLSRVERSNARTSRADIHVSNPRLRPGGGWGGGWKGGGGVVSRRRIT